MIEVNNLFIFLEGPAVAPKAIYVGIIIMVVILLIPWIALCVYLFTQKYQIRFFVDGELIDTKKYRKNDSIEFPVLSKEGYQLIGWYLDPEYEKAFVLTQMPKEYLKVYAKWEVVNEN